MSSNASLETIVRFLDSYLQLGDFQDYPGAMNGLQVERREPVRRVLAAVDASELTIREAVRRDSDLLVVHHGLFWAGAAPVTGRLYRKLEALIREDIGLYSAHLPLDAHPEVGNSAILARELGVDVEGSFGGYQGRDVGWWGSLSPGEEGGGKPGADNREAVRERLAAVVGGPVRLIPGGGPSVGKVGVLTGGGGSFIEEAARLGLDALVTGEGAHHTYFDAMELGVNVYYAGHYATETWGVRALVERVAGEFGLSWDFIDIPTGL